MKPWGLHTRGLSCILVNHFLIHERFEWLRDGGCNGSPAAAPPPMLFACRTMSRSCCYSFVMPAASRAFPAAFQPCSSFQSSALITPWQRQLVQMRYFPLFARICEIALLRSAPV